MDTIVVLNATDNVATCLKEFAAGQIADVSIDVKRQSVKLRGNIPFGHKIALVDIARGGDVRKYAEVVPCQNQVDETPLAWR